MTWLGHDTRSANVLATARLHIDIERAVRAVLPENLASSCHVQKMQAQRLHLAVPSPAHAAKLRQLGPTIGRALTAKGWNVDTIEVSVSGSLHKLGAHRIKSPKEAVPLEAASLHAFEQLHDALRPGPLADAVARLLAHHKPEE